MKMNKRGKRTLQILEKMTQEETHELRYKYLHLTRAARLYGISRDRLEARAKKIGAYYVIECKERNNILINMDMMDEYFEKTGELKRD